MESVITNWTIVDYDGSAWNALGSFFWLLDEGYIEMVDGCVYRATQRGVDALKLAHKRRMDAIAKEEGWDSANDLGLSLLGYLWDEHADNEVVGAASNQFAYQHALAIGCYYFEKNRQTVKDAFCWLIYNARLVHKNESGRIELTPRGGQYLLKHSSTPGKEES